MRKFLALFLASNLIFLQLSFAKELVLPTGCPANYTGEEQRILLLCHNVDDIICKDVKKEERRGCNDSDKYVFSSKTSMSDISSFTRGCFNSAGSAIKGFFTDFIPSVLREIIKITNGAYEGAVSLTSHSMESSSDPDGWWGKIKGIYESTASMTADIYEAATQDPLAFITNIWDKMQNIVSSFYDSYDCLKPQVKIEKVCGFLAGWFMPPAAFALLLVKGTKFIKESIELRGVTNIGVAEKLRLKNLIELSEKRPKISYKKLQVLYDRYKKLGYSNEEIDLLYQAGALEKLKASELKNVMTESGKSQRAHLLKEILPVETKLKTKTTNKKSAFNDKTPVTNAAKSEMDHGYYSTPMQTEVGEITYEEWKIVVEENKQKIKERKAAEAEKIKKAPPSMSERIRLKKSLESENQNNSHFQSLPEVTPITQEEWDETVRISKGKAAAKNKTEASNPKVENEVKTPVSTAHKIDLNKNNEAEKFYKLSIGKLPEATDIGHEEWLDVLREAKEREASANLAGSKEVITPAASTQEMTLEKKLKNVNINNSTFPDLPQTSLIGHEEWEEVLREAKEREKER